MCATSLGKWRRSISSVFMCPRAASRETDFTFLRNKAHNVRCTISRRYLRIAVFWDIKFSIPSRSIFQLCIPADLPRRKQSTVRTVPQNFCPVTRTHRSYGVNSYTIHTYVYSCTLFISQRVTSALRPADTKYVRNFVVVTRR